MTKSCITIFAIVCRQLIPSPIIVCRQLTLSIDHYHLSTSGKKEHSTTDNMILTIIMKLI